jgi:hypothetical protein
MALRDSGKLQNMKAWIPRYVAGSIAGLSLLATGCSPLYSTKPIGQKPVQLETNLNGAWLAGDTIVHTLVTDGKAGKARAAFVEQDQGRFKLVQFDVEVRQSGEQTFVSLLDPDEAGGNRHYEVLRMAMRDDQLLLWRPKLEGLKKAIAEKKLVGRLTNDVVWIEADHEKAAAFLASSEGKALFDHEDPVILVRLHVK